LTLQIFMLPGAQPNYDQISACSPSARYLVSACRDSQHVSGANSHAADAMKLALATFDLLFQAFVEPTLVLTYCTGTKVLAYWYKSTNTDT
jgi:hypothetical protein